MKKNGFAPLIIILVIAILGVVGYFGYKSYFPRSTFYIGNYKNPEDAKTYRVAFFTNTKLQAEFGKQKGEVATKDGFSIKETKPVDLSSIENPKKVSLLEKIDGILDYLEDSSGPFGYLMAISLIKDPSYHNYLYKIDLQNYQAQRIWENKTYSNTPRYPNYNGHTIILEAAGKYLLLQVGICEECSPGPEQHSLVLVLNTNTKKEKILGEVYSPFIDLDKKVARFQKYVPVKKSCDEDPGGYYDCVDGFISVSEPTKEFFSEPLP